MPENRAWDADEADAIWQAIGLYHLLGVRDPSYSQAWLTRRAVEAASGREPDFSFDPDPVTVTLPLDADIVEAFRGAGKGWRAKVNAALRAWLDLEARKASRSSHG